MGSQIGDNVRLKTAPYARKRGVIADVHHHILVGEVNEDQIQADTHDVTNLSLAAKKAWQSMPDRSVGRPNGSRFCDRVSVTLRIDRELWNEFRRLEVEGLIEDRTATINTWLREKTRELTNGNGD